MSLIDKVVDRIRGGGPLERRYNQNIRILSEFPWLWAVCSSWELSTDYIKISDSDSFDFDTRVTDHITRHVDAVSEFWIHAVRSINGRPMELVDKIWGGRGSFLPNLSTTWTDLLRRESDISIMHVAVVSSRMVRVIRPPKPMQYISEYIPA